MEHVREVGQEPHPMGSPENAEVRRYIFGELASLGLDPRVQSATVVDEQYGSPYDAATAKNVLARIEGTEAADGENGAVMLAALLWKRRAGSLLFQIYASAYVIAAMGFVLLLDYWNLLGFRY